MGLFYFKEKPTTPLRHGGKTTCFSEKSYKDIFAYMEVIKAFMKTKENGENEKNIQDAECLSEELQKYLCL